MSYFSDMRLRDLDGHQALRVTCNHCGTARQEMVRDLALKARLGHLSLSELEGALYCRDRVCRGSVSIALCAAEAFKAA